MTSRMTREAGALLRGAAIVALGIAYGAAAYASPQYNLDCTACHTMPPTDSGTARKIPATGAFPGNHQQHAGVAVSSCLVCHGPGVAGYGTGHRNGVIELGDNLGYSRKVNGFLNQTSVPPSPLGSCATATCHSNGKGTFSATPAWGSTPLQVPSGCYQCHGVAPATGNHPVSGSKHAAYFGTDTGSCVKCHSDHTTQGNPFSHATSAGNRPIEVRFNGGGSFANGQCANLYCHSNGKGAYATPPWGATLDCSGCHGTAASTGAAALSGKHANHVNNAALLGSSYGCIECHAATVSDNSTIADRSKHDDGSIEVTGNHVGLFSAGSCSGAYCHSDGKGTQKTVAWTQSQTLDCKGCHGSDPLPAFASVAGEPNYANAGADQPRANSHQVHATSAATCQNCHGATTVTGVSLLAGSPHTNGSIEVAAGNGKSFSYAGRSCSNVSCHNGNGVIANVAPAKWGASLGCNGCHGDAATLTSNAHAKHVNAKGYACSTCHAATVSAGLVIINPALHGDGAVEVQGSLTFTSAGKTCSTSCHGSATPSWTSTASGACGTCHGALSTTANGLIATNAHTAHFSAAYGPKFDGTSALSCAVCHIYTTDTAASHDNGLVDLNPGFSRDATCSGCHRQTANWAGGGVSCESCHSSAGGALSVINGLTAPDKTLAASAGHGKAGIAQGCAACHDSGSSHISGALGTTTRLKSSLSGALNAECNFCHQDTTKVSAQFLNMSTHFSAEGGGQTMACAACHDPHGTSNLSMIRSTINGQAINYHDSSTGFVNTTSNEGLCQVCHSATAHYRAGVAETGHPVADCLTCHNHKAPGGAFKPNGACDACHGYPPAPRQTTTALSFGTMNNWSSARFEDYSGGGGAHLVAAHIAKNAKPSDGWVNCLPCHNKGAASHTMNLPLKNHLENVTVLVDPQYRFSQKAFIVYTGAELVSGGGNRSGSCFNVACHLKPSRQWSSEK